ncbi:MAG: MurR/RpiR family transcriptional regulator, partial [Firmicutes bacterium]|nr:MurR/RpiR family transcriptional regulator [Bacillota bacterium]
MENLLESMKNKYPTLSKGQKRIADFLINHYDEAVYLTAAKLGETTGVSESTVVRFA